MSSDKEEEAKKAIDVAEKKLSENDYVGAKKFAYKAQNLHPEFNGLNQFLTMVDIYICASNRVVPDWYGVLGVDPTADDETLKRQYKKLALLIHPDKNKFNGAEGATKLVLEAWSVLSDEAKRIVYDQERKSKQVKLQSKMKKRSKHKPEPDSKPDESDHSFKKGKYETFWTICNRCKTYCQFGKTNNLNKTLICPNCGEHFVAKAAHYERMRKRVDPEADRAKTAHHERMKRWFEPELYYNEPEVDSVKPEADGGDAKEKERLFKKMATKNPNSSCSGAERLFEKPMGSGNADSTLEAERLFKKMTTENPNSTLEAERLFEKAMGSRNADSTLEAERLFKKPMATENPNSSYSGAERLFEKPMGSENADSTLEAERLFREPIFFI